MNIYIAKWPNGTISILTADDKIDLFDKLDREGDPFACQLVQVNSKETEHFHLTTEIKKQGDETFIELDQIEEDVNLKKVKLPKDAFERNMARFTGSTVTEIKSIGNLDEIKKQMGIDQ